MLKKSASVAVERVKRISRSVVRLRESIYEYQNRRVWAYWTAVLTIL
jgi:hypothetical protein